MNKRTYASLFLIGLSVNILVGSFQSAPGYMDADYYFAGGLRLATGHGFTEPFLWNYLDDPTGLHHPSHAYWMPLASIFAAASMFLGRSNFPAGRIPFLILASLVPVVTAALAYKLTSNRKTTLLAGLLAVFSGFYLPFYPTTDTFAIDMLLGALFLLTLPSSSPSPPLTHSPSPSSPLSPSPSSPSHPLTHSPSPPLTHSPSPSSPLSPSPSSPSHPLTHSPSHSSPLSPSLDILLGIIAALMHLARADGLLWLVIALLAVFILHPSRAQTSLPHQASQANTGLENSFAAPVSSLNTNYKLRITSSTAHFPSPVSRLPSQLLRIRPYAFRVTFILLGYLLIMTPWMFRNFKVFGTLLSPGGSRALWLTNYDELFAYPASLLTFEHWWRSGLSAILQARTWALGMNLQTALAVQGGIFLAPLIILGAWRLRRDRRVQLGLIAWALTFLAMTIIFPFQGARGGFFHSGAALQPLFWALAAFGLESFLSWGVSKRDWDPGQAGRVFSVGLVGLALFLSLLVTYPRVIGDDPTDPVWNRAHQQYVRLETALNAFEVQSDAIIMVNNPPGYYLASGRPAISIPDGNLSTTLAAAKRYHAGYILLESNHPSGLEDLYENPGDRPGLSYLGLTEGVYIFRINPPSP